MNAGSLLRLGRRRFGGAGQRFDEHLHRLRARHPEAPVDDEEWHALGPELLRDFGDLRLLIFAVGLLLIMLFRPSGIWPVGGKR